MKLSAALSVILSCLAFVSGVLPASAADYSLRHSAPANHAAKLPFPRSERAQSVWASDACWMDCGAHCAWGLVSCIRQDDQGRCVAATNSCDRYCQRTCRTYGGPLVPDLFDFQERPFVLR